MQETCSSVLFSMAASNYTAPTTEHSQPALVGGVATIWEAQELIEGRRLFALRSLLSLFLKYLSFHLFIALLCFRLGISLVVVGSLFICQRFWMEYTFELSAFLPLFSSSGSCCWIGVLCRTPENNLYCKVLIKNCKFHAYLKKFVGIFVNRWKVKKKFLIVLHLYFW